MRFTLVLCALSAVAFAEANVEWTVELTGPPSAATLWPNVRSPEGVVVAAGQELLRLDGRGEVLWRVSLDAHAASPASVADIDADGRPETTLLIAGGTLLCFDNGGSELWRLPFETAAGGFKSVAAADVHPSPGLELIFGFDDGWLRCASAKGEELWKFLGDPFRVGPPAAGDADGDGQAEIVYGTDNGHVYCLDGFGQVEWRYEELAPYGRSGPNISDLDNDGRPEVLITRSNVGLDRCIMALDGATGTFLWRSQDMMQGYVSNAFADFDGEGRWNVLHGDKGNHLYCENHDGSRAWQVELGGRGLFWAPAVADIDGDGYTETVAGMRGEDPETGASVYVIGADGTIDDRLDLGSDVNSSPAIGDIDGDGQLEVLIGAQAPPALHCVSWNGGGRVDWPSLRGDSAMSGRAPNVAPGGPAEATVEDVQRAMAETAYWGENELPLTWNGTAPKGAFLEVRASGESVSQTRIFDVRAGATSLTVPYHVGSPETQWLSLRLVAPGEGLPLHRSNYRLDLMPPDECGMDAVEAACGAAMETGREAGADIGPLGGALARLEAKQAEVQSMQRADIPPERIAEAATALRVQARRVTNLAALCESLWREGRTHRFACWHDVNPWDSFDPNHVPREISAQPIRIQAFQNESEDIALTLLNLGTSALDVRCMFSLPVAAQQRPQPEPEETRRVTLRRAVPVGTALDVPVFDALPELDLSRSLTVPVDETRQLWLVVNTEGLEPGVHTYTLYLGSLGQDMDVIEVPIEVEIWPVRLPDDVYVKMNWSNFNAGEVSDQCVEDMLAHGLSCIYGPPLPSVPVDAQGNLAGEIDWAQFDETLARVPKHFFMLWGAPPARQWPDGITPEEDSEIFINGVRTAIHALNDHLEQHGFTYDQWAFYPIDEPWNTGFTHIPDLKRFCTMIKRAEPRAQNYTDPAGLVRVEYVEEFKDLIDIWQPEMNLLKRDPELVEWFRLNADHFWAYEAPGPGKNLLPLGHFRAFAWLAWSFGCEGAGYWVYKANDIWWPIRDGDWSAVYQTNDLVVPSRRWEADRDGVEDYRALHVLAQEIDRARNDGRTDAAEKASTLMADAVADVVGWQIGSIDEITRMTRDYELDYDLLLDYRRRMAEAIMTLRSIPREQ